MAHIFSIRFEDIFAHSILHIVIVDIPHAGLHLEIDPRGGEMSIYEKEGGAKPCVHERLIVG